MSATEMILEVTDRVPEGEGVVSLRLAPVEGPLAPFRAGQHLPIHLDLTRRQVATYTISSDPADRSAYRISVKRVADGRGGSAHLHAARIGQRFRAAPPRGHFVAAGDDRAVILLSGGIGVTPALAMAHHLARQPSRPVWFVHACRSREALCFAGEIADLAARAPNLKTFFAFTRGTAADRAEGHCDHVGRIDRDILRALLPLDAYTACICGPDAFMRDMRAALQSLGVADADIAQETFGAAPAASHRPFAAPESATTIHFARSGRKVEWTGGHSNLLDFAEAHGLQPDFSCRAGICGSCACRKLSGETRYAADPLDPPGEDEILLCCSVPAGPVTLDL